MRLDKVASVDFFPCLGPPQQNITPQHASGLFICAWDPDRRRRVTRTSHEGASIGREVLRISVEMQLESCLETAEAIVLHKRRFISIAYKPPTVRSVVSSMLPR
jgi:hypothetical protein